VDNVEAVLATILDWQYVNSMKLPTYDVGGRTNDYILKAEVVYFISGVRCWTEVKRKNLKWF